MLLLASDFYFYHGFLTETWTKHCNGLVLSDRMGVGSGNYDLSVGMSDAGYNDALQDISVHTESKDIEVEKYYSYEGTKEISCVNRGEEAFITAPVFDFDNYHAYDMGTGEELYTERNTADSRLRISIPAGYSGTVSIRYEVPQHWSVYCIISAAAYICLFGYGLSRKIFSKGDL